MSQTRSQIKSNIDANITTNGNEEITGAILRSVLNNMADNLATEYAGYQYAGVAVLTPSQTNSGTPDGKVFYIATQAGTYTNFGSLTVAEGEVAVLKYNGSAWSKDVTGAATKDELNQLGQEINGFHWEGSFSGYENKPIQLNAGNYIASIVGTLADDIKFRDANGTIIKALRNTETYPLEFSISQSEAESIVEVRTYNLTKLTIEGETSIVNDIQKIEQKNDALNIQINGTKWEGSFYGYENKPITFVEGNYIASIVGTLTVDINFRDSGGNVVKSLPSGGTYPMEFSISASEAASIVEVRCYNLTKLTIQSLSGVEYEIAELNERVGEPPYYDESNPTGASYNLIIHGFKKNHHYLVSMSNYSGGGSVYFNALPDATDPSVKKENVVVITNGESQLWTPDSDYEALRYGVVASAHITVEEIDETQRIFYCGAGTPFTKLTDAIVEATKYWGSILYVGAGTYDLISELGSTWFDNVPSNAQQVGPKLKNKIHIIFDPNSKVVANYTGDNVGVLVGFSPFNAGEFGFILENLNLECSRCRYAIHDEQDGNQYPSLSHYKNCNLSIDNTNNPSWSSSTCIGGGLGSNSSVRVDGCTFKSVTGQRAGVYYHNSNQPSISSFRSLIEITGCYFVNGSVYIDDGRTDGTLPTIYLVSNNSFAPISGADANGMATEGVLNPLTIIRAWNNQIRNN